MNFISDPTPNNKLSSMIFKLIKEKVIKTSKKTTDSMVDTAIEYMKCKITNIADEYLLNSYSKLFISVFLYLVTFMLILLLNTFSIIPSEFIFLVNIMYLIIIIRSIYKSIKIYNNYFKYKKEIYKYVDMYIFFMMYKNNKVVTKLGEPWIKSISRKLKYLGNEAPTNSVYSEPALDRFRRKLFLRKVIWDLITYLIRPIHIRKKYSLAFKSFLMNILGNYYEKDVNGIQKWFHVILGEQGFIIRRDELFEKVYEHICFVIRDVFKKKLRQYLIIFALFASFLYIADQFMLRYVINKTKLQMITEPVILLFERVFR